MALSNEQLIEELSNKPIMEVVELVKALEEKWGVSAAAPIAMAAAAGGGAADAAAQEEQTEFEVVMKSFGENKVAVIKVVRTVTGLGLKEAKATKNILSRMAKAATLGAIDKKDIVEIKSFNSPPTLVKLTIQAVCMLFKTAKDLPSSSTAIFKRKFSNPGTLSMYCFNSSRLSSGTLICALIPSLATYTRPNTFNAQNC